MITSLGENELWINILTDFCCCLYSLYWVNCEVKEWRSLKSACKHVYNLRSYLNYGGRTVGWKCLVNAESHELQHVHSARGISIVAFPKSLFVKLVVKLNFVCDTFLIHPSIINTASSSSGSPGRWSRSQLTGRRQGTPWTGSQSIEGSYRDIQPFTLTFTPMGNLEIN